VDVDIRFEHF